MYNMHMEYNVRKLRKHMKMVICPTHRLVLVEKHHDAMVDAWMEKKDSSNGLHHEVE